MTTTGSGSSEEIESRAGSEPARPWSSDHMNSSSSGLKKPNDNRRIVTDGGEDIPEYDREFNTEVIDPEVDLKFLRVVDGDEELAMIPWPQAREIAAAVLEEDSPETTPFDDWYAEHAEWWFDDEGDEELIPDGGLTIQPTTDTDDRTVTDDYIERVRDRAAAARDAETQPVGALLFELEAALHELSTTYHTGGEVSECYDALEAIAALQLRLWWAFNDGDLHNPAIESEEGFADA